MTDAEFLIKECSKYPNDSNRQILTAENLVREDEQMLQAAVAIYEDFCKFSEIAADPSFLDKFVRSWAEFSINALSNVIDIEPVTIAKEDDHGYDASKVLYIIWHFPAYPLVLKSILKHQIIALVAQDVEWMRQLMESHLAYNFRTKKGLFALKGAICTQRSMVMMLDYCYPGTRHQVVDFLGRPCKTPSGLIHLALRSNYSIRLVTYRHQAIVVEDVPYAPNEKLVDILGRLNKIVSSEITFEPSRWLLWPSLNSRSVQ